MAEGKQYCRYCIYCHYSDFLYCDIKGRLLTENTAKTANKCKEYEFVDCEPEYQDALMENTKGYKPREPKQKQCDGQLRLEGV